MSVPLDSFRSLIKFQFFPVDGAYYHMIPKAWFARAHPRESHVISFHIGFFYLSYLICRIKFNDLNNRYVMKQNKGE